MLNSSHSKPNDKNAVTMPKASLSSGVDRSWRQRSRDRPLDSLALCNFEESETMDHGEDRDQRSQNEQSPSHLQRKPRGSMHSMLRTFKFSSEKGRESSTPGAASDSTPAGLLPTPIDEERRMGLVRWLSANLATTTGILQKTPSMPHGTPSSDLDADPQETTKVLSTVHERPERASISSLTELRGLCDDVGGLLPAANFNGTATLSPFQCSAHGNHNDTRQAASSVNKTRQAKADLKITMERGPGKPLRSNRGVTLNLDECLLPQEQHKARGESLPASPCSGVLQACSPRYGALQRFRKEMASHGLEAQILRSGWKSRLLPPRDVRIFITDRKKDSTIWLRPLKEDKRAANGELEQEADLGLNCRHTIPLRALANVGPAEIMPTTSSTSSFPWAQKWRVRKHKQLSKGGAVSGRDGRDPQLRNEEDVPVLALSYWVDDSPRWAGDMPKRLLIKPKTFHGFQRLMDGLRLCCLHFHNNTWPQDLEDIL